MEEDQMGKDNRKLMVSKKKKKAKMGKPNRFGYKNKSQ